MRRVVTALLVVAVVASLYVLVRARAQSAGALRVSDATYKVKLQYDVKVPMRDGVKLSTDIYRPDAPGQFGVIVIRTPYDNNAEGNVSDVVYFAQRGYAVVVQDDR